ncbi:MAG: Sll0314/Alr1548 family TPR repeat-containing protein [Cyanobacteria bacterium P01_C01_bin.120]
MSRQVAQRLLGALLGLSLALLPLMQPSWAGDPFRPQAPRNISAASEQAFYAMFRDGDYVTARDALASAEASDDDPLFHALGGALAYLEADWDTLAAKATLTEQTAARLIDTDPMRSNLYEAVGVFLQGAHVLQTEGIAQGTPKALAMLQQVFDHMETAEAIAPQDPELSLLKGYMDLLLAVNLPFANPERAIAQLQDYGYPTYVAYRGIALGYRDLDQDGAALEAADVALAAAPENPDLLYLKAQLLRRLERKDESIQYFDQALAYADQLPSNTLRQLAFERCHTSGQDRQVCRQQVSDQYGV